MQHEKLPPELRKRLVVLYKHVLALNATETFDPPLTMNRLSGAVCYQILKPEFSHLSQDELMDQAANLTNKPELPWLLEQYDMFRKERKSGADRQVAGIVRNLIPESIVDRERVIKETIAMVARFRLVKSIPGIRKLVKDRLANNNQDLDELNYLDLH